MQCIVYVVNASSAIRTVVLFALEEADTILLLTSKIALAF